MERENHITQTSKPSDPLIAIIGISTKDFTAAIVRSCRSDSINVLSDATVKGRAGTF